MPLPWQGCARRAHSSPGWERPGDTRRGVTGAVEKGGERVRTREESRTRGTRAFGVGMGSLESAPRLHTLDLRRLPTLLPQTLAGVQDPHPPVSGERIQLPNPKVFWLPPGWGGVRRAKCPYPTHPPQAELQSRLRPEALQLSPSPSPAPPAGPLPGRACTANYSECAAADHSGVLEAARGGDLRQVKRAGSQGVVPGQGSLIKPSGCGPMRNFSAPDNMGRRGLLGAQSFSASVSSSSNAERAQGVCVVCLRTQELKALKAGSLSRRRQPRGSLLAGRPAG